MTLYWSIPAIAYLLGSIPFGFLIVKALRGRDVRSTGSGNIGAANVARSAGAFAGILTLLCDAGKGYLAVWIAARWVHGSASAHWMIGAAVAAVIGHVFSIWLRFKGGKGVATMFGAFLPISGLAVAAAAVLWILVVGFWRYSSLGSMASAAALPILVYLFYAPRHAPPTTVTLGTVFVSLLVLVKHSGNLRRLMDGTENRLSFRR
ncbi:MAG: glycerol-3-phosphate 1-O-acyltransferase PlsY [Candidatus Acidiferrales bacterium]